MVKDIALPVLSTSTIFSIDWLIFSKYNQSPTSSCFFSLMTLHLPHALAPPPSSSQHPPSTQPSFLVGSKKGKERNHIWKLSPKLLALCMLVNLHITGLDNIYRQAWSPNCQTHYMTFSWNIFCYCFRDPVVGRFLEMVESHILQRKHM